MVGGSIGGSSGGTVEVVVVAGTVVVGRDVDGLGCDTLTGGNEVVEFNGGGVVVVQVGCSGCRSHFHASADPTLNVMNPSAVTRARTMASRVRFTTAPCTTATGRRCRG